MGEVAETGHRAHRVSFELPCNQQRCSHPGWSPAALQPYQSGGMTTPGPNSPHPPRWSSARTDSCAGRRTLLLLLLPTGLRFHLRGPQPGCNYKPGRGPIPLPPQLLPAPPSPRPVVPMQGDRERPLSFPVREARGGGEGGGQEPWVLLDTQPSSEEGQHLKAPSEPLEIPGSAGRSQFWGCCG